MIKTLVYIYLGLIINFIHDKREKEEDGCFQNADDTSSRYGNISKAGYVISSSQDKTLHAEVHAYRYMKMEEIQTSS